MRKRCWFYHSKYTIVVPMRMLHTSQVYKWVFWTWRPNHTRLFKAIHCPSCALFFQSVSVMETLTWAVFNLEHVPGQVRDKTIKQFIKFFW